jgi:lipopolysaccharide transport system ATP-binding protein
METGTVLFVSHDTKAVLNLCHHAIWLEQGKMRKAGTPKDICESYMQAFYEAQQGNGDATRPKPVKAQHDTRAIKNRRPEFSGPGNLRNRLEVFKFDPGSASFGKNGARITSVQFADATGAALSSVAGGELVTLTVESEVYDFLRAPIVGFNVKDRLGQALFGENTYLTCLDSNIACTPGATLIARFTFCMPCLPSGAYSVAAGVADGSQEVHTMEHWMHDAVIFYSDNQTVTGGLIGIPMQAISLHQVAPAAEVRQ